MIDGCDAITACYRFAGALHYKPPDLKGVSLRDLWLLYCGKMAAIRRQVLWQANVILAQKAFDHAKFLRNGELSDQLPRNPQISAALKEKVAILTGCWNRGLPEPDFTSPTWKADTLAGFEQHDRKQVDNK